MNKNSTIISTMQSEMFPETEIGDFVTSNSISDKRIMHIYDKIIKRILTLSPQAVINLINGLFGTDYPVDSEIIYNWTERVDDDLNRTIADTIVTINRDSTYHIEAQMYTDEQIELRVFNYGYRYALTAQKNPSVLVFPEPKIIYLYKDKNDLSEKVLVLDFGSQGTFEYRVPIFKLLDYDAQDLYEKKMTILLPFLMLRLREELKKKRTTKNIESLKSLIQNDIIELIKASQEAGEITRADAARLLELAHKLYNHLYSGYPEMEEGGINDFMDENLNILYELDLWERNMIQRVTKQVTEQVTEQITEQVTKDVTEQVTRKNLRDYERKTILKLYEKLRDVSKVAEFWDIDEMSVRKIVESE